MPGRAPETVEALPLAERRRGEDDAVPAFVEVIPENVCHLHGPDGDHPVADEEDAGRDMPRRNNLFTDRLERLRILLEIPEGGLQAVDGPGVDSEFPAGFRFFDEGELSGDSLEVLPQIGEMSFQLSFAERRVFGGENRRFPRSGGAADGGERQREPGRLLAEIVRWRSVRRRSPLRENRPAIGVSRRRTDSR